MSTTRQLFPSGEFPIFRWSVGWRLSRDSFVGIDQIINANGCCYYKEIIGCAGVSSRTIQIIVIKNGGHKDGPP